LSHPSTTDLEQEPSIEQRAFPRYPILQRCYVAPAGAQGPASWPCIAYNISATGIGITLPTALLSGTVVEVRAWGLPAAPPLLVRVVHVKPVAFLWYCGGEFLNPLDEKDLQAWLAGPLDWVPEDQSSRLL
jgi:hypothetical protein